MSRRLDDTPSILGFPPLPMRDVVLDSWKGKDVGDIMRRASNKLTRVGILAMQETFADALNAVVKMADTGVGADGKPLQEVNRDYDKNFRRRELVRAIASFTAHKRMPHKLARQRLDELLDNAAQLKASDAPFEVDKIWLFGSFAKAGDLSPGDPAYRKDFGDLDISIETKAKDPALAALSPCAEYREPPEAARLRQQAMDWIYANVTVQQTQREFGLHLRNNVDAVARVIQGGRSKSYCQVTDLYMLQRLGAECRLIYSAENGRQWGPLLPHHPDAKAEDMGVQEKRFDLQALQLAPLRPARLAGSQEPPILWRAPPGEVYTAIVEALQFGRGRRSVDIDHGLYKGALGKHPDPDGLKIVAGTRHIGHSETSWLAAVSQDPSLADLLLSDPGHFRLQRDYYHPSQNVFSDSPDLVALTIGRKIDEKTGVVSLDLQTLPLNPLQDHLLHPLFLQLDELVQVERARLLARGIEPKLRMEVAVDRLPDFDAKQLVSLAKRVSKAAAMRDMPAEVTAIHTDQQTGLPVRQTLLFHANPIAPGMSDLGEILTGHLNHEPWRNPLAAQVAMTIEPSSDGVESLHPVHRLPAADAAVPPSAPAASTPSASKPARQTLGKTQGKTGAASAKPSRRQAGRRGGGQDL